jgi:hypothetical protein
MSGYSLGYIVSVLRISATIVEQTLEGYENGLSGVSGNKLTCIFCAGAYGGFVTGAVLQTDMVFCVAL